MVSKGISDSSRLDPIRPFFAFRLTLGLQYIGGARFRRRLTELAKTSPQPEVTIAHNPAPRSVVLGGEDLASPPMPTIEANKSYWDGRYDWERRGDEWSAAWGGPYMQWHGTILPRIKAHVPTSHILEVGCGYGRWTHYLKDLCTQLTVIDLSEECIRACQERFASSTHLSYHVNDGSSLSMVKSNSVDFAFSFDSLVHADELAIDAYVAQLSRVLKNRGVIFLHHSNLGAYFAKYKAIRKVPKLEGLLRRLGALDHSLHWRDFSVDANKVRVMANRHGLECVSQELVRWRTKKTYLDCMSILVKSEVTAAVPSVVFKNPHFMNEASNLRRLSRVYDPSIRSPFSG